MPRDVSLSDSKCSNGETFFHSGKKKVQTHTEGLRDHLFHDTKVRLAFVVEVHGELEEGTGGAQAVARHVQLRHRVYWGKPSFQIYSNIYKPIHEYKKVGNENF